MNTPKRAGIMGGTFNPIHIGHLTIAEAAREAFGLNEVLFIPSGVSYMKSNVLDKETRVAMTKIAIEDNPYFVLSTIEADRDGDSYSYETIATLRKLNPDTKYYFIVGADSLSVMHRWKNPEKIFAECTILAAIRSGSTPEEFNAQAAFLKEQFHADIRLIPAQSFDLSSTAIREKAKKGDSIRYLVPDKVREYIQKNNIYRPEAKETQEGEKQC